MIYKKRHLILFLLFFLTNTAFSQTTIPGKVLAGYNNFLKAVKLNRLLTAVDFSFRPRAIQGNVYRTNVWVLSLSPASTFTDPLEFAGAWNKTVKKLNGEVNVYQLLLVKLTDYTPLSIDSLVVQLKMNNSDVFSFMVYFNGQIRVIEPLIGVKGTTTDIGIDPSDFNNIAVGGIIPDIPYTSDIADKITDLMKKKFAGTALTQKSLGPGLLYFSANYKKGPVTKKYREAITLDIMIEQSLIRGYRNLYFTFQVKYAGGMSNSEINPENYRNAIDRYYHETSDFGAQILELLKQLQAK